MAHNGEKPIFVIGNPRSGTTLLRLMLTCHPRIVIPPEAGFLIQLLPDYRGFAGDAGELRRFVAALVQTPKFEFWKLPEETLVRFLEAARPQCYADLAAGVYRCFASVHEGGRPRWGDKNNFYLAHIDAIASLYPGAVFIHIVRDGRDVACSYRSLATVRGAYAPSLPSETFDAMMEWTRNLARIRRSFDAVGWERAHELRYEDLVREPERTLREACAFLGEAYDARMLDYARENRERELEPRAFDAWKERNRSGIDEAAIGRWKTDMPEREAELAGVVGARMLRRYQYESVPSPSTRALLVCAGRAGRFHARRLMKRLRPPATRSTSSSS